LHSHLGVDIGVCRRGLKYLYFAIRISVDGAK
jgi:hypothetical protein